MALAEKELYTNAVSIEYIKELPEGKRAELINGEIYMMAPPNTRHQRLSMFLSLKIGAYIEKKKGKCEVFAAPFAVYLNNDDYNYVEPDLCVVCDSDKIDQDGCHGAPDFIIEIVSPSSRKMDYIIKLYKYQQAGVREYWVVDPKDKSILVYFFEEEIFKKYKFKNQVKVNIYEDLEIDFSEFNIK